MTRRWTLSLLTALAACAAHPVYAQSRTFTYECVGQVKPKRGDTLIVQRDSSRVDTASNCSRKRAAAVTPPKDSTPPAPPAGAGEPVYDSTVHTIVYRDNMDRYVSPTQMWADYNAQPNVAQMRTQEGPTHPGWEVITPGRGGVGKALRVNYLGQQQTGASWNTNTPAYPAATVTHVMTYYARVTFSAPLGTNALGVKWFEGTHPGANRIQWHMHWLNGSCSPVPTGGHTTYWQVMDNSRSTACQGAQPVGPYIENAADGQWRRFTYEYKSHTTTTSRDGFARMWINGVKVLDVSQPMVGVTPAGGNKPWCRQDDVDAIAVGQRIGALKFGDIQTTTTPAWTLDVDDLVWWRR